MKLKICGLKYEDNISEVEQLQPDYMGFIFYEKSKRNVEHDTPNVPKHIKKTGVFVDASKCFIIEKIEAHNLQAVQLHGNESSEFCNALKEECIASIQRNIEIIKVFSVDDNFNFSELKPFESACDYFLFDTKGKLKGGNGYTFNWNILKNYTLDKPYFLSGGIGIEELENLNAFYKTEYAKHCYAIDINSRFEIKPGLKNITLLSEFKSKLNEL